MQQQFQDRVTLRGKRRSKLKSNGDISGELRPGELLHFAQLARQAVDKIEIEKSLREVSLKINQAQGSELRQIGMRLHDVLSRSLDVTNPGLAPHVMNSPVDGEGVAQKSQEIPPVEAQARQDRTLINRAYPVAGVDKSLLSAASPFSIV